MPQANVSATLQKVELGGKRILTDPKFVSASIAFIILIGSAFIMGIGATPADKLHFFQSAVWSAALIYASALGALGYEGGKLLEGTVPAGFVPVNGAASLAAPLIGAVLNGSEERLTTLSGASVETATGAQVEATVRQTTAPAPPRVNLPMFLWLALSATLLIFGSGCSSTSAQFQQTIGAGVSNVVADMRTYTANNDWDTNHDGNTDASEAAAKAAESAKTDALAASVATPSKITVAGVETAWGAVKPVWINYVTNDPTLADPANRKMILDTGVGIDNLIAVEKAREGVIHKLFSAFGL